MPEIETALSISADEYGTFNSFADVFRQIGHDERVNRQDRPNTPDRASGQREPQPGQG